MPLDHLKKKPKRMTAPPTGQPDTRTGEPKPGKKPEPRPVIPRDPDGTKMFGEFTIHPAPHHTITKSVPDSAGVVIAVFTEIGSSEFECLRRIKVRMEAWRATLPDGHPCKEKTPAEK